MGFAPDPSKSTEGSAFEVPVGQRQLFLDDDDIAEMKNLKRTMHTPDKEGAVIRLDPDIESSVDEHSVQVKSAPIWDPQEKIWKLWSTASRVPGCSAYWESKDGLHWYKPVVGQVEYQGSRENNYVSVQLKDRRFGPVKVVYDPTDPDPGRRYKAANPPWGFGVSPDGVNWKGIDISVWNEDTFAFSFDEQNHLFVLTVREGGMNDRRVLLTTSEDFEQWTEHELIFRADELDQEIARQEIERRFADPTLQAPEFNVPETYNAQVYEMGVFRYESRYIGLPMMFYRSGQFPPDWEGFDEMNLPERIMGYVRRSGDWTGVHVVQLTSSRDLRHWQRLGDREPFIGPSRLDSGAYDTLCIGCPHYPAVRGDELWFYYPGIKSYAYVSLAKRDAGAICLAVLRRDGFISLDAGEEGGTILTKPFTLPDGKLFVNVDAPGGELRAEMLDPDAKVIATSAPLKGDLLREKVRWAQGNLEALQGQQVALRLTLHKGSLYSYWIA